MLTFTIPVMVVSSCTQTQRLRTHADMLYKRLYLGEEQRKWDPPRAPAAPDGATRNEPLPDK